MHSYCEPQNISTKNGIYSREKGITLRYGGWAHKKKKKKKIVTKFGTLFFCFICTNLAMDWTFTFQLSFLLHDCIRIRYMKMTINNNNLS